MCGGGGKDAVKEDEEEGEEEEEGGEEMESPENPAPVGDPMKNEVNWPVSKSEDSDRYDSEDEEDDKWDNSLQKCWTGYTQRGMKEKNGRMVPNCVPVEKVQKAVFEGTFDPFDLVKRKFSSKQREEMAASGEAMPDGSYPIANRTDLMNAIRSWGRGGADPKVKSHIKRRAKALGLSDMIPDNWK